VSEHAGRACELLRSDMDIQVVTMAQGPCVVDRRRQGGATHEFSREDPNRYSVTVFGQSDGPIEDTGLVHKGPRLVSDAERSLRELAVIKDAGWREARVELYRRLAFPVACLVFALVAVPLGAQPRRGGRAAGSLIAIILIASYYLLTVIGAGLARQGALPPALGSWGANILLAILGLTLLPRMEQFRGESQWLNPAVRFRSWARLLRRRKARARAAAIAVARIPNGLIERQENGMQSSGSFPRLMDIYLLRRFFFYFALLMAAFIFLFETFTFFELLDDIARHRVPFLIVIDYFRYLTPYLLYNLAPLGALLMLGFEQRGEITDERALLTALERRWIAGAALDTLAGETPDVVEQYLDSPQLEVRLWDPSSQLRFRAKRNVPPRPQPSEPRAQAQAEAEAEAEPEVGASLAAALPETVPVPAAPEVATLVSAGPGCHESP